MARITSARFHTLSYVSSIRHCGAVLPSVGHRRSSCVQRATDQTSFVSNASAPLYWVGRLSCHFTRFVSKTNASARAFLNAAWSLHRCTHYAATRQGELAKGVPLGKPRRGTTCIIHANPSTASLRCHMNHIPMKYLFCAHCGHCYDESKGCPSSGIAPGTPWEDLPMTWCCTDCGARKCYFDSLDIVFERAVAMLTRY
jgi:rubredoxin